MMSNMYKLFLSLCLVAILPTLHAKTLKNETYSEEEHVKASDDYWKQRAEVAAKANREAYVVDPYEVTYNLSSIVSETMMGKKSGRRNLKGRWNIFGKGMIVGPCIASNPIDSCWMCDPHWAEHRQRLADCGIGFGRKAVGGKGGPIYIVHDSSDNDLINPAPGTLRHAVTRPGPLWIIFARSMGIRLTQELMISDDKTIDGRGFDIQISGGAGITIQSVRNVIIHGIKINNIVPGKGGLIRDSANHFGYRTRSDGDGISIFGSSNIWIDHVTLRKCTDGLIDVINGSTAVTISNNHFSYHNKVMLFGASDLHTQDEIMQVTVAFNKFGKKLIQRMPRCRRGFFHLVNNDYAKWEMYAIGGSMHPTIISEGNRFIAPDNAFAKEITKREKASESEWMTWQWRSIGDLYLNGAFFREAGPKFLKGPFSKLEMIAAKPAKLVEILTRNAGARMCKAGQLCH